MEDDGAVVGSTVVPKSWTYPREREKCKGKRKRTERKRNRIGGVDTTAKSRKELEWMDKKTVLWIRILAQFGSGSRAILSTLKEKKSK